MMVGMERGSIDEMALEGRKRRMSYGQFVAARYYPVEIVELAPDGAKTVRSAPLPPVVLSGAEIIAQGRSRSVSGPVRSERPRKERPCVVCGRLLIGNQRKYCSDECTRKAHDDGKAKVCTVCGEPLGLGQMRYCSQACRYEAQKARQKDNRKYIPVDLPDRPCKVCGKMMHRPMRHQNYCGPDCKAVATREIQKAYREANREAPKVRICKVCGGEITGKGIKYCTSCAAAEGARRNRERQREYAECRKKIRNEGSR